MHSLPLITLGLIAFPLSLLELLVAVKIVDVLVDARMIPESFGKNFRYVDFFLLVVTILVLWRVYFVWKPFQRKMLRFAWSGTRLTELIDEGTKDEAP